MDDEKAGYIAGGAVLVGVALGGIAMAVLRRVLGPARDPLVAEAESADELVEPEG